MLRGSGTLFFCAATVASNDSTILSPIPLPGTLIYVMASGRLFYGAIFPPRILVLIKRLDSMPGLVVYLVQTLKRESINA